MEKTSYSSNKNKGIDDFSKDIICSDRTLKKWEIINKPKESISNRMKEHYNNEINKRINIHHRYVYASCNDFTLRYCELENQKKIQK